MVLREQLASPGRWVECEVALCWRTLCYLMMVVCPAHAIGCSQQVIRRLEYYRYQNCMN